MDLEKKKRLFSQLYPEGFNIETDFEASKLIVAIRNGKPYHYWKNNCNITKDGIYTIRLFSNTYLLKEGKLIEAWNDILDAIDLEIINTLRNRKLYEILRDEKINNILDDK
jgi:hypothetical protein